MLWDAVNDQSGLHPKRRASRPRKPRPSNHAKARQSVETQRHRERGVQTVTESAKCKHTARRFAAITNGRSIVERTNVTEVKNSALREMLQRQQARPRTCR
jgi:hypothetical protein